MDKFNTGLSILQGVFSLIHFAEAWYSDTPKTGEQKKQLVMSGLESIVKSAEAVTTGGAHKTWEKIEKIAPEFIDDSAQLLYPPNK